MSRILMLVALQNYRDEELDVPRNAFLEAGHTVTIASKTGIPEAAGMLGGKTIVDVALDKVDASSFDAVVFVGGGGATVYFDDQAAHRIAKESVAAGKILGAICIAPSILANAGVLSGRKVTAFSSEAANLESHGAEYTGSDVEVDGKIVTANGPEAAEKFATEIMKLS